MSVPQFVPQLSVAEIDSEIWTVERCNYYRPLYEAAERGDWKSAISFIDNDPDALTAEISLTYGTVLHVAAMKCQWNFILMLVELVSTPQSIAVRNSIGITVLHYVALNGSLRTAKALIEKNSGLLQMVDHQGNLPLLFSLYSFMYRKSKKLVWYFSLMTRVDSPRYPGFIPSLPRILRDLISLGYYDIALYFVQRFPHLALANDENGDSLLKWLADKPSNFLSGSNLGFSKRWIYKFVHVEIKNASTLLLECMEGLPVLQSRSLRSQVLGWFKGLLGENITRLAPSIEIVRDAKMTHECAIQLVNHVVYGLSYMNYQQITHFLQNPTPILDNAVGGGIEEIVGILSLHFPDLISSEFKTLHEGTTLQFPHNS